MKKILIGFCLFLSLFSTSSFAGKNPVLYAVEKEGELKAYVLGSSHLASWKKFKREYDRVRDRLKLPEIGAFGSVFTEEETMFSRLDLFGRLSKKPEKVFRQLTQNMDRFLEENYDCSVEDILGDFLTGMDLRMQEEELLGEMQAILMKNLKMNYCHLFFQVGGYDYPYAHMLVLLKMFASIGTQSFRMVFSKEGPLSLSERVFLARQIATFEKANFSFCVPRSWVDKKAKSMFDYSFYQMKNSKPIAEFNDAAILPEHQEATGEIFSIIMENMDNMNALLDIEGRLAFCLMTSIRNAIWAPSMIRKIEAAETLPLFSIGLGHIEDTDGETDLLTPRLEEEGYVLRKIWEFRGEI